MLRLISTTNAPPRVFRRLAVVLSACFCNIIGISVGEPALARQDTSPADQPFFCGLGDLPGGQYASFALAISGDGRVVAGNSNSARGNEAFLWKDGVLTPLGALDPDAVFSTLHGLSRDGSVAAGSSTDRNRTVAFRAASGAMSPLTGMPDWVTFSEAWCVSADGATIAGAAQKQEEKHAFIWNHGAFRWLDSETGGESVIGIQGISADGGVVAGNLLTPTQMQAFIWRDGAFTRLPGVPGGNGASNARAISADGRVIVGAAPSIWGYEAFRFADGVMTPLGGLSDHHEFFSIAADASADGSIVIGSSEGESGANEAFIWDVRRGMRSLREVLINEWHLDLAGWTLTDATGVSDDGLSVVGMGRNPDGKPEGWLARLPRESEARKAQERSIDLQFQSVVESAGSNDVVLIDDDGAIRLESVDQRLDGLGIGDPVRRACSRPSDIDVRGDIIAVTDMDADRVALFRKDGGLIRRWGSTGDGNEQFRMPAGVAIDDAGRVVVADSGNDRVQVFDQGGNWLKTIGRRGRNPGFLLQPADVIARGGRIIVADQGNQRLQMFDADGNFIRTLGRRNMRPHERNGSLHLPRRLAASPDGRRLAVLEPSERCCLTFECDAAFWTSGASPIPSSAAPARSLFGEVMDVRGGLLAVAVPDRDQVEIYDLSTPMPQMITAIGDHGSQFGQFNGIAGIRLDPEGRRMLVSDAGNRRLQEFIWGDDFGRGPNPPPPGTPPRAKFSRAVEAAAWSKASGREASSVTARPGAIEIGPSSEVLVIDRAGRRVIALDGSSLQLRSTIGGAGSEVGLGDPLDLAVDAASGSIFVLDRQTRSLRVLGADGRLKSTWPLTDGGEPLADPRSVAAASGGGGNGVYVVDGSGRIVRLDSRDGHFEKSWGTRGMGADQLFSPRDCGIDGRGRLAVLEWGNHRVQFFDHTGPSLGVFGAAMFLRPAQLNQE